MSEKGRSVGLGFVWLGGEDSWPAGSRSGKLDGISRLNRYCFQDVWAFTKSFDGLKPATISRVSSNDIHLPSLVRSLIVCSTSRRSTLPSLRLFQWKGFSHLLFSTAHALLTT